MCMCEARSLSAKARLPVPASLDLCFIASCCLEQVIKHLRSCHWPMIEGSVQRTGATGPDRSVYMRDPDLNLIEISEPIVGNL